jgi:hypothetical protein
LVGIETAIVGPLVVVVEGVELGEEELLHAAAAVAMTAAIRILRDIRLLNGCAWVRTANTLSQIDCPIVIAT